VYLLAQRYDRALTGGDTTISWWQLTQRALVPTISQAWSFDTMGRRHFGQKYPASARMKSYSGPIYAHIM
jgi:hypothetical protein